MLLLFSFTLSETGICSAGVSSDSGLNELSMDKLLRFFHIVRLTFVPFVIDQCPLLYLTFEQLDLIS